MAEEYYSAMELLVLVASFITLVLIFVYLAYERT